MRARLLVRWTIGDVSLCGFEALRLSVHGAWRLFGNAARYVVCVNTVAATRAAEALGDVPAPLEWRAVGRNDIPTFLRHHIDEGFAEGVAWKFAPLSLDTGLPELALDNDCVLWSMPDAIIHWVRERDVCVIAEDVRPCYGQFAHLCGDTALNSGIRATPGRFDLGGRLRAVLHETPIMLRSELGEQGLQVAALRRSTGLLVVRLDEVSVCSPFSPHQSAPGICGVHFVGLNSHGLPWRYFDRPATECVREHWVKWRDDIAAYVGARPAWAYTTARS
jgi:hypothetical protein